MSEKFYFKVHGHQSEVVIAICDDDIRGQTFTDAGKKFYVSPAFYGDELVDETFVRDNITAFTILNLAGNRAVELAISVGLISPSNVIEIGGMKHAQAVKL